jgi:sugar-specific transcriptional regulator TrmB
MSYRKELEKILTVFDLTDNCSQLYIKSFEAGEQSISWLAEKLSMDRSSVYLAVDQLKNTGLIEIDETKRPMRIRAVEPRKVLGRIEHKIQSLEETFDTLHNILPQLEAAYASKSSRPVMQSYIGKDGLRQIMEDILAASDDEMLILTNQTAEKEVFTKYDHEHFIRKRKQQNLTARVIATDDKYSRELQAVDKQNLRVTKILAGKSPFSCELYIYGDKVAMLIFRDEIMGFIVSSSDFTQLMKWQFESIWGPL